jgi:hypothetical protein
MQVISNEKLQRCFVVFNGLDVVLFVRDFRLETTLLIPLVLAHACLFHAFPVLCRYLAEYAG